MGLVGGAAQAQRGELLTLTMARYRHNAIAKAKLPATAMAILEVDRYCSAGKNLRQAVMVSWKYQCAWKS